MVGKILHFDAQQGTGIIRADDGNRYPFIGAEVRNMAGVLSQGMEVDFDVDEQGVALEIYVLGGAAEAQPYAQSNPSAASVAYSSGANGGMNFKEVFTKEGFKELFRWEGCYTRSQYWRTVLLFMVYSFLLTKITNTIVSTLYPESSGVVSGFFDSLENSMYVFVITLIGNLPALWVMLMSSIKRFHDINKSGVLVLLNIIPFIGTLIVLIMNGLLASEPHNNRFCDHARRVNGSGSNGRGTHTVGAGQAQSYPQANDVVQHNNNVQEYREQLEKASIAFTMPAIEVETIKKYKFHLLIGIPFIIAFGVWFFIFRSVTVLGDDVTIGHDGLSIKEHPFRQNFIVTAEVPSGMMIPKEMIEYVKEVDGKKRFELEVSHNNIVQGIQTEQIDNAVPAATFIHIQGENYSPPYYIPVNVHFWKDGVNSTTFIYDGRNLLISEIWDSNHNLATVNAYDEQGKIYKTVKFVNGKGIYKKYYPGSKLQLVESYDLKNSAMRITLCDENGSEINSYSSDKLIDGMMYDLWNKELLKILKADSIAKIESAPQSVE